MSKRQKRSRDSQAGSFNCENFFIVFPDCNVYDLIVFHNLCWDWRDVIQGLPSQRIEQLCDAWIAISKRKRDYAKLFHLYYLYEHGLITRIKYEQCLETLGFTLRHLENSVLMQLGLTEREQKLEQAAALLPEEVRLHVHHDAPDFVRWIQGNGGLNFNPSFFADIGRFVMSDKLYFSFVRMAVTNHRVVMHFKLRDLLIWKVPAKYYVYIVPKMPKLDSVLKFKDVPYLYDSDIPYILAVRKAAPWLMYVLYCAFATLVRLSSHNAYETVLVDHLSETLPVVRPISVKNVLTLFAVDYQDKMLQDSSLEKLFKTRLDMLEGVSTTSKQLVRVLISLKVTKHTSSIFLGYCEGKIWKWSCPSYDRVPECISYALENDLLEPIISQLYLEKQKDFSYCYSKLLAKLLRFINWQYRRNQNPAYDITRYVRAILDRLVRHNSQSELAGFVGLTYSPDKPPDEFFRWQPFYYQFTKGCYAYNSLVFKYKPELSDF